jgi:hypothetical protein
MNFSNRYVPKNITNKDQQKQIRMLLKSRKMYKKHHYYTRKPLASFKNKKSNHVENARRMYRVETITPNQELARKTGCTMAALQKIVKKGEGAYYSSGSRPNQTPQSWGLARLASSITAGKAANVDFAILEQGCDHKKKAFRLAKTLRRTSR